MAQCLQLALFILVLAFEFACLADGGFPLLGEPPCGAFSGFYLLE